MHPFSHVLNIGTLATWLSVGTFGTVGVIIPGWDEVFTPKVEDPLDSVWIEPEITLGDAAATENFGASAESATAETLEPLAPPPELPELAELPPLPEVPDFPPPPRPVEENSSLVPAPQPITRRSTPASDSKPANSRTTTTPATTSRTTGNGKPGATGSGQNSGMSDSARLAAGRMPSPSYPPYSRRNQQTGTVIVEFTVDAGGRVISANVKSSSNWPLLDNEAVSTVRRWKFPPGGIMKLQRPIVFRLN